MKVYLAGGMKELWRDSIKKIIEDTNIIFYDPTKTHLTSPAAYTLWDLTAIKNCDVVVAYFEATNPSGVGLACEIGYAVALGKTVILINGQPENHYFDFVVNAGVTVVKDLVEVIGLLDTLSNFFN